jgi:hypothetical protein
MDLKICPNEWTQEPTPDRALVVSAVTSCRIAFIPPAVLWIHRRQATQAEWSEQVTLDSLDDRQYVFRRYHFVK